MISAQLGLRGCLRRLAGGASHPAYSAQFILAVTAVAQLSLMTRALSAAEFATWAGLAASWAILNAFAATPVATAAMRSSARGHDSVEVRGRDLATLAAVCLGGFLYGWDSSASLLIGLASAIAIFSFATVEVAQGHNFGSGLFRRYLVATLIRVGLPVLTMYASVAATGGLTLLTAICAVAGGNVLAALYMRLRVTLKPPATPVDPIGPIGIVALSLWIIASGNKIVLERIADPHAVAAYVISYGLLDRGYRALANGYTARHGRAAFQHQSRADAAWRILLACVCVASSTPLASWLVGVISGSRYEAPISLVLPLSIGLAAMMLASAPYLAAIAAGQITRASAVIVIAVASGAVILNVWLIPHLGVGVAAWTTCGAYIAWLAYLVSLGARRAPQPELAAPVEAAP